MEEKLILSRDKNGIWGKFKPTAVGVEIIIDRTMLKGLGFDDFPEDIEELKNAVYDTLIYALKSL